MDSMFDLPLFNPEFFFGSFGHKDSNPYIIYDWPLFRSSIAAAAAIYKEEEGCINVLMNR